MKQMEQSAFAAMLVDGSVLAWGNPEDNWGSSPHRLGQKMCSRFALAQLSGLIVRRASGGDIRKQDKLDKTGHEVRDVKGVAPEELHCFAS